MPVHGRSVLCLVGCWTLAVASLAPAQQQAVLALNALDPYHTDKAVNGKVQIIGSGAIAGLSELWADGLKPFHPQLTIAAQGGGSETGLEQLAAHPQAMAAVTRPIEPDDLEALRKAGLKQPVAVLIGLDALAVFVNANNPLSEISPAQLQQLYCVQPSSGRTDHWGQLGLTGDWANKSVAVLMRGAKSGTQTFVHKYLLSNARLRSDATVKESNAELVQTIGTNPDAVAIAPLYLKNEKVKTLDLRIGGNLIKTDEATIMQGNYPLVRPLFAVFDASSSTAGTNRELLRFVLSREGQMDLVKTGFYPLNPAQLRQQQDILGVQLLR